MTTGAMILARMDSRRLPGKALLPIGGRPLLSRVLDRTRLIGLVDVIVVTTTDRPIDDPIVDLAEAEEIPVFRGPFEDVAQRCLLCALEYGMHRFARISGDSMFFDPALVEHLIQLHKERRLDVATNVAPRTFPPGASVELIATEALRRALGLTDDAEDREHVTPYFYRHPSSFELFNYRAPDNRYAGVRLAVDDEIDLARAEWIVSRLDGPAHLAATEEITALARDWDAKHL